MAASDRVWWRLAWGLWLAALPLRLVYFAGYGLGDDPIFFRAAKFGIVDGHLNLADPNVCRLGQIIPQMLFFHLFPANDWSFVLPTFLFALGTHAASLFLARDLLGARGALLTSAFFLTSPYETLTATAFAPDYIVSFWTVLAAIGCWRGLRSGRHRSLALGGAALAIAVFSKTSALLAIPVFGIATLVSLRRWRGWLAFWATFAAGMAAGSLVFVWLGKSPLHWYLNRADRPEGHDVTDILGLVLAIYPRYLFLREPEYGHWMFGVTGWLAAFGVLVAVWGARTERWRGPSRVVLLALVGVLLLEFMPHKLDLHRYFSHPRIFRYLAQVSALVYLAAAFGIEVLLSARRPLLRTTAVIVALAAWGFGLWEAPRVSEPSWDSNRDGRALSRFFHDHAPAAAIVQSDYWQCYRLEDINFDQHFVFRCPLAATHEEKERLLSNIHEGYVITGGGHVAWYSGREWALDLSTAPGFTPPPSWYLLFEYDRPTRPWRHEPLRVWRVDESVS